MRDAVHRDVLEIDEVGEWAEVGAKSTIREVLVTEFSAFRPGPP